MEGDDICEGVLCTFKHLPNVEYHMMQQSQPYLEASA